nr:TetR/AcrR family transcriptional regulator [uncultured Albidiferax sp.]
MPTASSSPSADTPAKRTRRKESRPSELLAAALDLFVEKGFAATRVEEVAQRAGVSKGTLFLYFPSKDELFKAVVRQTLAGRFHEWSDEVDSFTGSSAELLHYGMHSWWERVGNTQASGMTKLMLSEAQNFPEMAAFYQAEVVQPYHSLVQRILQRGVDRGEFAAVDLELATYAVTAPLIFLAMWKHSVGTHPCTASVLDPLRYLDAQVQILLNGLRVRPAPA